MRKIGVALVFCAAVGLGYALNAHAAQEAEPAGSDDLVPPVSALLSPTGGRLDVAQKVRVVEYGGRPAIHFVIPANAGNLQMLVPDHTIARWSSTPVLLNNGNPLAGRRARVEQYKLEISSRLKTVNSRLHLWQSQPQTLGAQEMSQLQAAMQADMPQLWKEQAALEQRLRLINEELSRMPNPSDLGERIRVILADNVRPGDEVTVYYSYQHDGCGWEPVYDFNARPDQGEGGVVDVRIMAEVWQFTGINWRDTEITLATKGFGPREPAPLPDWVIDSTKSIPAPQPRAAKAATMALKAHIDGAEAAIADNAPVVADTDTVYASWQLTQKGLPQGRSRMQITSTTWKTPLQWLARPSQNSNQVWLMAKYNLPPEQTWAAGMAEYSVDGLSVGSGDFRPKGNEANLYFGPDPRVTIRTTDDSRKRGESGFINANKTWTWNWTYTITNRHNQPVQVRVERPAAQIVDKDVTVTYKNEPRATEEQHMLVWTVDVPAHGEKSIENSVTISSPTKLPLLPDVP